MLVSSTWPIILIRSVWADMPDMRVTFRFLGLLLILAALILISLLMASHLPYAADASKTSGILERDPTPSWRAFHIVVDGCPCSARLLEHLKSRSLAGFRETTLILGRDLDPDAAHERYGFEGVPWLVIADPAGRIRYSGGYTVRADSLDYQDFSIAAQVRRGQAVPPLPAFGCATRSSVRYKVKPFRYISP